MFRNDEITSFCAHSKAGEMTSESRGSRRGSRHVCQLTNLKPELFSLTKKGRRFLKLLCTPFAKQ